MKNKYSFSKTIKDDLIFYGGNNLKNKFWLLLFDKNFKLLFSHRVMVLLHKTKFSFLNRYIKYKQEVKYGGYISVDAKLGRKIRFAHSFGIVIGPAVIEDNVTIFQQVTIGSHGISDKKKSYPTIKSGVKLFAGSKAIGDITIGNNAIIGAGAVVTKDIPANSIAIGIPAKIVAYL